MTTLTCRFCGTPLRRVFVDLGMSPLSNAYLAESQLLDPFVVPIPTVRAIA